MTQKDTLYDSIKQQREIDGRSYQRIMLAGYFNQEQIKRDSTNIEVYIKESLANHKQVKSYFYLKGVFYVQLLQAQNISYINNYLTHLQDSLHKRPSLVNVIRIVHQSYENSRQLFKTVDCDNNPQPGPILVQTQKTEEQIQDRSFQIYEQFIDGARKRAENASHKIGNMILLSNDDMGILICNRFMNLQEYLQLYTNEMNVDREEQGNYPLPPSFYQVMQFLEIEQYEQFRK